MQKNDRKVFLRVIIYIVEIIACYALEQVLKLNTNATAGIFILVPAFVSISFFECEFVGMAIGVLAGLLADYSFGAGIGVCAALFGLFGYIIGVISNYFFKANVITHIVVSAVIILCTESAKIFFIARDFEIFSQRWQDVLCKDLLFSLPAFVLIFYFSRAVSYKFFAKGENLN